MGISDVLKFFMDIYGTSTIPVRFAYIYWILFIGIYVLVERYEKTHNLLRDREVNFKNYHGTLYLFGFIVVVLHHGSLYANWGITTPISTAPNSSTGLGFIGFMVMGFGLYLVAEARVALNGYWGIHVYSYPVDENGKRGELIRNGIYKHCRHPVYAGQISMTSGTVLLANDWLVAIFPAGTVILSIWRAIQEEKELHERFADEFIDYKKKTSFIIPYIK